MKLVVNGAEVEVEDRHAKTPLLWVLRDVLGLPGTKFGCGAGFCAACTVLIDGRNTKSCQTATERAVEKSITTIEGAEGPVVDAVRDAWHRGNVVQCGYCQPGQMLAAVSLLEADPAPDDAKIDERMSGNLCRCGTYPRIRAAIQTAAGTLAAGDDPAPLVARPDLELRRLSSDEMADPVHPYIRIHEDGTIVAYSSQIEMGQGIHTGLATIVAEELDADFDSVVVVNAANGGGPPKDVYGNPDSGGALQITGAFELDEDLLGPLPVGGRTGASPARGRSGGALGRARRRGLIRTRRRTPRERQGGDVRAACRACGAAAGSRGRQAQGGVRLHADRGRTAARGLRAEDPRHHSLHDRRERAWDADRGGSAPAAVRLEGRIRGRQGGAVRARRHGGGEIEEGVAVVAESVADAQRGLRALTVEWDDADAERRSSAELLAEHVRLLESGEGAVVALDDGNADAVLAGAPTVVDETYALPYVAHAAMEPNNAACRMREDGVLEVWASTESPEYARMSASEAAGIDKDQVEVNVTFAGGSFGLHSSSGRDPIAEAVQVARALDWKHPIKLQSLREEDFKSGRYRAMAVHRVRAAADSNGRLTAYHQQIVAEPTSVNLPFVRDVMFTNGVDFFTTTGAADPPYAFRELQARVDELRVRRPDDGVALGRQLAHRVRAGVGDRRARTSRPVATPSICDESCSRTTHARCARSSCAADIAGWTTPPPEGRARGITCSSFLSHSANVTEISLDARERVHVDRIVFVLDCGITINPDLVRAQVEGGLLFGLSAAAWGEVVLGDGGEIVTQNFDRYPIVRMRSVPQIEVHLIESTESPTGVGEVSVPSVAPALANAIAALTGTRIRQLPLSKTIKIY